VLVSEPAVGEAQHSFIADLLASRPHVDQLVDSS
jgi:hypothetical protein